MPALQVFEGIEIQTLLEVFLIPFDAGNNDNACWPNFPSEIQDGLGGQEVTYILETSPSHRMDSRSMGC
uniref:Uncharacterized protein n=1 Tax=Candidatus Kentrum sp. SD TaxID=2126332 RepID=A0A450YVT0_9GAMM|nr:MAG: hypothetical protein BECKSD772F_GA0070984_12402 [Candidatus Kentron sp. SD]VFK49770.1 MAG: hypothetical protein BECKSD772E_GA0070983_12362 [Candidatus Kentron sp. SD]VFK81013.1 MAG: hypothetical protein BECKSD772D_GA0070982_11982 [Candidatus Kentron sp. SD]